ncbi:hypothetical protein GCM10020295_66020 [Streptomyces cinereospinus]
MPAVSQRPVSTAYSDQAASAVNRDSVYAIDCTIPTGGTAHSSTAQTPTRRPPPSPGSPVPPSPNRPCTWSATAKIPQAAASEASRLTAKPAPAYDSGVTVCSSRSSQGSSGKKKARLECTSPLGRRTS